MIVAALAFGPHMFAKDSMIGALIKVLGFMKKPTKNGDDDDDDDDDDEDDEGEDEGAFPNVPLHYFDLALVAGVVKAICTTILSNYA